MMDKRIEEYARLKSEQKDHFNMIISGSGVAYLILSLIFALIGKKEHNIYTYLFGIVCIVVLKNEIKERVKRKIRIKELEEELSNEEKKK